MLLWEAFMRLNFCSNCQFQKNQNLIVFCFRYGVQWGEIQQRRKMSNIFLYLHSINKIWICCCEKKLTWLKSSIFCFHLILFHLEFKSRLNIERKTFSILQRISSWFVLPQKELLFSYTNYRSLRKILLQLFLLNHSTAD